MTNQTKHLFLTLCGKGGVGKSSVSTQYREKTKDSPKVTFFDGDIHNLSLYRRYKNAGKNLEVGKYHFYDESDSGNISKQRFIDLINELHADKKKDTYFVDCSATVSENIPTFFQGLDEGFNEVLQVYNIRIHLLFIVGGADLFTSSMLYYGNTKKSVATFSQISTHVFVNKLKALSGRNIETLESSNDNVYYFTLSGIGNNVSHLVQKIEATGKGLASLDLLTSKPLETQIKKLPSLEALCKTTEMPLEKTS